MSENGHNHPENMTSAEVAWCLRFDIAHEDYLEIRDDMGIDPQSVAHLVEAVINLRSYAFDLEYKIDGLGEVYGFNVDRGIAEHREHNDVTDIMGGKRPEDV